MEKQKVIRCFNDWAGSWDANQIVNAEKINRILDASGLQSGDRVLDIACGTGVLTPFLLERGAASILGVDIAERMCEIAREKHRDKKQVRFLCADAETASFSRSYARCIVFNAFPHFSDREALLKNLLGALLPGGTLTVAHDRGRAALDRHHAAVRGISEKLPPAALLKAWMEACGYVRVRAAEDEEIYIVTAEKGESL